MQDPPKYEAPAPDPQIAILQQKAAADNIAALGETARMDTARLAMLYGQAQVFGGGQGAAPDVKALMKTGAGPMQGFS